MNVRALSTLFFRNGHLLWMTIAVVLVAGASAVFTLPRLEDPRIVHRDPVVITPVPGLSAERVDALVTERIEEALDEIEAVERIESTSRAGVSIVQIELAADVTWGENDLVFAEIRDEVAEVAPRLPPEAGVPIVDTAREPVAYTLITAVTWEADAPVRMGVVDRLAEDLADALRAEAGTDLVRLFGGVDEELTLVADVAELAELGLSGRDVARRVAAADSERPAGTLRGTGRDVLVEVTGALDTSERVAAVPIATGAGGGVTTVGDVARVERGWRTPEDTVALVDGRRGVLVAARMAPDVLVGEWATRAHAVVDDHRARIAGAGLGVEVVFDQETYTTERLGVLAENLLAGVVVVVLAVLVTMGLRSALIVGVALPLVVSIVLFGWSVSGAVVHQISVFGLIIALGLLIDNAIVVTDEVRAGKARGMGAADAVHHAVAHLFAPLLASTLTTVLAFAPIMLLPGSVGDFVGSIGTSVILAVVASFVVALTVTAGLAGRYTAPSTTARWWNDGVTSVRATRGYRATLRRLLAVPIVAVAGAMFLPAAGFVSTTALGSQFFPPTDRDVFELSVRLPNGTPVDRTLDVAAAVETSLRELDGVEHVAWLVGASFPSVYYNLLEDEDRSPHVASGVVRTVSADATTRLVDEAQRALDARHPEAQIVVRRLAQGPPIVADIEYRLIGRDVATLQAVGDELRAALQDHPEVLHTIASAPRGEPKLFLDVDERAASLAGLTLGDVAAQLEGNLEGSLGGTVREDLEELDVRVRHDDRRRETSALLASTPLVVPGADRWVTAASLGELALRPEIAGVPRFEGRRVNTIQAFTRAGALPIDVGDDVLAGLDARGFELPPGVRIELGGASEEDAEATAGLAAFAPTLGLLMIATLVLAFRSVRYALVLGVVAVACVGLAMLSTWTIDFPVSFNTMLGTLGLIGVGLNDSIVVLAALRADPRAASGDVDAVVDAVIACTRHVVATTVTTVGGFLPLLLFVGGDFWPSLAIVLVGGILGASIVALLFVPAAHLLIVGRRDAVGVTP